MAGTFDGKSMKLGQGGRAAKMKAGLESKGMDAHEAGAVVGMAGRKKYGASKMGTWAAKGRARAAKG